MKAPRNLSQDGAGQMSLIPAPPFSPVWPSPSTLEARALQLLMTGRAIDHPAFEAVTRSWRLAAYVNELRGKGWPIESREDLDPIPENPHRAKVSYWLPAGIIRAALELRAKG